MIKMLNELYDKIDKLISTSYVPRSLGIINVLAVEATRRDPLIARRLEVWQYAAIIVLAISLVFLVRVISPKVEHAILFAVFLSVILIAFFFIG